VLLLGFLVLLSSLNRKEEALQTPSYTPQRQPRCNHSIVNRVHVRPEHYHDCMNLRCNGGKPLIRYPDDPNRGSKCTACHQKIFCSDNSCICWRTP
jgi:hypothetical protein